MMEMVDMQDLGAVTSVKVFYFVTRTKIEYTPVAKMVYAADLGSASLRNRGSSPLGRTINQTLLEHFGSVLIFVASV